MSDLQVSQEFIDESLAAIRDLVRPSHKFAPYSRKERQKRRLEVFRLHIDLGYSAVRISELMRINRNTINQDIKWCYAKIGEQFATTPDQLLDRQLFRHETQRVRLVEGLEKTNNLQERLCIEKMILDLDSRIATVMIKIRDSEKSAHLSSMKAVNDYLDKHHKKDDFPRFILKQEFDEVTKETRKRIDDLIDKGKKWHRCKSN
ncbi:MAG: hypothetical protein KC444_06930 [Nitrosopumilus sp.]|nr:hypothetical protein [Nitrosopumilus sp.]